MRHIDFSKTFDCIDHQILISKLKCIDWTSYFENRYQGTLVEGTSLRIDNR